MNRRFAGRIVAFLLAVASFGLAPAVHAADEAPDTLIKRLSDDVLGAVKNDKTVQSGDINRIIALVDSKIMPHVNFQRMTASAVGPAWRQATPEQKLKLIRKMQTGGELVAMVGDGTNDAPALAQSDVAVVMNSGTQAAKEAGNMIDLDSDPTKLIEVVEIGKQLLMTRGALTTFSISNDVAKYFAILPALFAGLYLLSGKSGPIAALNIMNLQSPTSAILSAVIFNAIIIVALIPLALKGVAYRPAGADRVVLRNLLIYGLGGIITPFLGIKVIDMLINAVGWV